MCRELPVRPTPWFDLDADGQLCPADDRVPTPDDLDRLDSLGLTALLARLLLRAGRTHDLDAGVRRRLRRSLARGRARGLRWRSVAEEVVAKLRVAGVEVVLLKGADLAFHVYPDPGSRGMLDLDLLVRRTDLEVAAQALAEAGFRESLGSYSREWYVGCRDGLPPLVRRSSGAQLDVHGSVLPPYSPFRLPDELVWADTLPSLWAGARRLARPVAVWHLIAHGRVMHPAVSGVRERLHADLLAMVARRAEEPVDWQRLLELCRRSGVCGAAAETLEPLAGSAVPDDVVRRAREAASAGRFGENRRRLWHEVRHAAPFLFTEGPLPPDALVQLVRRPLRLLVALTR